MFSLLYDLALLLLFLCSAPKWIWQRLTLGKHKESLKARLGFDLPTFSPRKGQKVIWIHTISMGETRAIIPLFKLLKTHFPDAAIVLSTTTETGQAEAKRSMPKASAHFYLPLDFSWTMRRLYKRLNPSLLLLCESDFWYNLLKIGKERGVPIALVNGKLSERSCRRFQKVPFFTRRLFSCFDTLCVQNTLYQDRFLSLGISPEKIHVTGNLKLDVIPKKGQTTLPPFKTSPDDLLLVIGSTHAPEEEWILSALEPVWEKFPQLKVLIVPRHPERFDAVAELFEKKGIPFGRLSDKKNLHERLILIDAMGVLNACYENADLAFVGGSFVSHVGGHNIFEPVLFGVPVLFGPHMHSQQELRELILSAGAGKEVTREEFSSALLNFLTNPSLRRQYSKACHALVESVQGATERTFEILKKDLVV